MSGNFYGGSMVFKPYEDAIGFSVDKINFVFCQLLSWGFALVMFNFLAPHKVSVTLRLHYELWVGLALAAFCFGYQVGYAFALGLLCYLVMAFGPRKNFHSAVLVLSMTVLSIAHIRRLQYDYSGYTLDITGPLMILVQKVSSLAYNLHDGTVKNAKELPSAHCEKLAVRKLPSLLEYFSYLFTFHGFMAGPFTFFIEYKQFIDPKLVNDDTSWTQQPREFKILWLIVTTLLCGAAMTFLLPSWSPAYIGEPAFLEESYLYKWTYILVSLTLIKQKYYFAWKLSELVSVSAGVCSFNEKTKEADYSISENVDILGVELSTSMKVNMDSWNKTTLRWLRLVVYERAPFYPTVSVFGLSCLWHGFYPGYYYTFFTGGSFIIAARKVRRNFRERFQSNAFNRYFYDFLTFLATRFHNVYLAVGFVVLKLVESIQVYYALGFLLNVTALLAIALLPNKPSFTRVNVETKPRVADGGAGDAPVPSKKID